MLLNGRVVLPIGPSSKPWVELLPGTVLQASRLPLARIAINLERLPAVHIPLDV
jgi:hypothetical protein